MSGNDSIGASESRDRWIGDHAAREILTGRVLAWLTVAGAPIIIYAVIDEFGRGYPVLAAAHLAVYLALATCILMFSDRAWLRAQSMALALLAFGFVDYCFYGTESDGGLLASAALVVTSLFIGARALMLTAALGLGCIASAAVIRITLLEPAMALNLPFAGWSFWIMEVLVVGVIGGGTSILILRVSSVVNRLYRVSIDERDRYRIMTEQSSVVPWELDLKTFRFIYVGPSAEQLLGIPSEEWKSESFWLDHLHPDDRDHAYTYCLGCSEAGKDHDFEYRMLHRDGTARWVHDVVKVIKHPETGKPKRLRGVLIDITERKVAEQAAREEQSLLEAINRAQEGYLSEEYTGEIFQRLLDQLLSATQSEYGFIGEVLRSEADQPYLKTFAITDISWDEETRALYDERRELGMEFYNLDTLFGAAITSESLVIANSPAEDERRGGIPVGHPDLNAFAGLPIHFQGELVGLIGIANRLNGYEKEQLDRLMPLIRTMGAVIGALKSERSRDQALETNRVLRTAVEQSLDLIDVTDETGKTVFSNAGEGDGSGTNVLPNLAPNSSPQAKEMWDALRVGNSWTGRLPSPASNNGNTLVYESTVSPIVDASGTLTNFIAVHRDITREYELESQLRQSQKLEALGRLAGGVAHDFNNLLQIMRGNAELMWLDVDKNDLHSRHLAEIITATERAGKLVKQLLAFGRKQVLRTEPIDMNTVIDGLLKMLDRVIGEDVHIAFDPGTELPLVIVDPTMVEQVLMNLAVNARDAMPAGGELHITTRRGLDRQSMQGAEPTLQLTVRDTGIGIPDEIQDQVFEPFFSTKGESKGSGLGLSTVYGIVDQHGGTIGLSSVPGKGTTIVVSLPAVERDSMPAPKPDVTSPEFTAQFDGVTVLFAEDDAAVQKMGVLLMERAGLNVICAKDGNDALTKYHEHADEVDLLLFDVVMPGENGVDVYRKISDTNSDIPAIFASGYSSSYVDNSVLKQDRVELVSKPFSPATLLETMSKLLGSKQPT